MKTFRTDVQIAAPPARVWQVITDFAHWGDWNAILRAKGEPTLGAKLIIYSALPYLGPRQRPIATRITTLEPEREVRWSGGLKGVMSGAHGFRLEAAAGGTRVFNEESFEGALLRVIGARIDRDLPDLYRAFNDALKSRAESSGARP